MTGLRRFLVVLLAYLSAALVGVSAFLAYGFFASDGRGWDVNEIAFGFAVFVPVASIYALPISLPMILLTELRQVGHWAVFAISGIVLGVLLTITFTEIPYQGLNLELAVLMTILSFSGAMIYWLVAWRLLPPRKSALLSAERSI